MTTYSRGDEVVNDSEIYDDFFEKRGITQIIQYTTKVFGRAIKGLSIDYRLHYWSHGDRYHKLASIYYKDFRLCLSLYLTRSHRKQILFMARLLRFQQMRRPYWPYWEINKWQQ